MFDYFPNLQDAHVTVMGLGQFGGGIGAVKFLLERGAKITLTDVLSEDQLEESLDKIDCTKLHALHLDGHREDDFVNADFIVVNPAVPRDNSFLELAQCKGIPLTSEMNLFWQYNPGRVAAVTGSNGKSTTTALLHSILQTTGQTVWLGGNIGQSLLPLVDQISPDDFVVLELSSFQLADLDRLFTSPELAVVTNFTPNHLNWHGSLADYRYAKQTLLRWQTETNFAVLNADDPEVCQWKTHGQCLHFGISPETQMRFEQPDFRGAISDNQRLLWKSDNSETEISLEECWKLPGEHQLQNALAASTAALAWGVSPAEIQQGLQNFQPLPHRLQFVAEYNDRKFYNDSLATTPESAICGLRSFSTGIVLLAGGSDKQVELGAFAEEIAHRCRAVALMGETASYLDTELESSPELPRRCCTTFPEAFGWAVEQSQPGDIVLLSPGCASFDWFRNFADRGEQFTKLVAELSAQTGHPLH